MERKPEHRNSQPERKSFFELFVNAMAWLQIVASPLLIGLVIGALIYFFSQNDMGLILGIFVAVIGLIIGIVWANEVWKKEGASHFISKIMGTPELDPKEEDPSEQNQ